MPARAGNARGLQRLPGSSCAAHTAGAAAQSSFRVQGGSTDRARPLVSVPRSPASGVRHSAPQHQTPKTYFPIVGFPSPCGRCPAGAELRSLAWQHRRENAARPLALPPSGSALIRRPAAAGDQQCVRREARPAEGGVHVLRLSGGAAAGHGGRHGRAGPCLSRPRRRAAAALPVTGAGRRGGRRHAHLCRGGATSPPALRCAKPGGGAACLAGRAEAEHLRRRQHAEGGAGSGRAFALVFAGCSGGLQSLSAAQPMGHRGTLPAPPSSSPASRAVPPNSRPYYRSSNPSFSLSTAGVPI